MAKIGRPLKFTDANELEAKINKYFDDCDKRTRKKYIPTKNGIEIVDEPWPRPYTVEGLAVALDTCRETLLDYQKNSPFSDIILRAKARIQANKVEGGLDGTYNSKMAEFMLRVNHKYKPEDNSNNEHTVRIEFEE